MTNQQVTLFEQGEAALSTKFQPLVAAGVGNDLGDGIRGSYGIVSIKSGRFRIKYRGQETMITDNGNPVANIDVVIVKANAFLNKQFYAGKYVEGSNSPPDCWSLNGKTPSPEVKKPQHSSCELCPKNQWGSLIGDNGQKQKACRDTKKLAIVPLSNIRNVAMGGAMLFRVPPSSLKDLSTMADSLKARGYPYNSVAVRVGFDMSASHPKPTFRALRPLTDDEADAVLEMFNSDSVSAVLADNDVVAAPAAAEEVVVPAPVVPVAGVPAAPPVAPAAPPVAETPTIINMPPPPPGPKMVIQPFNPDAQPAPLGELFGSSPTPAAAPQAPAAPPSVKAKAKAAPAPVVAESEPEEPVPANALEADIGSILAGLGNLGK